MTHTRGRLLQRRRTAGELLLENFGIVVASPFCNDYGGDDVGDGAGFGHKAVDPEVEREAGDENDEAAAGDAGGTY